jgi:GDPmannose 4,6-dehydratase
LTKALITGITGQDGSYLAEFLLSKGYEVHGIVRHVALEDPDHRLWRIRHLLGKVILHSGSLESYASIFQIMSRIKPDECYHLAAQSFVSYSFEDEFSTVTTNINGTMYILSSILHCVPKCKVYFAGSSEMFGKVRETPQKETTPFHPRSPYGISKVAGFEFTRNYREAYDIFACNGMLFNHESPRRGYEFVTRKITSQIARILKGEVKELALGNLDAQRDWGFAGDYIVAMWQMLQHDTPDDYVVGTGNMHSVRLFVTKAFEYAGVTISWKGIGVEEKGYVSDVNKEWDGVALGDCVVRIDDLFFRPSEVEMLQAESTKIKKVLQWKPSVDFNELVAFMMQYDLERLCLSPSGKALEMVREKIKWVQAP